MRKSRERGTCSELTEGPKQRLDHVISAWHRISGPAFTDVGAANAQDCLVEMGFAGRMVFVIHLQDEKISE